MNALAITPTQKQAFLEFQAALSEGSLHGAPKESVNHRLGGLGRDRVKDVVEERAFSGLCGNVICAKSISRERVLKLAGTSAVALLSDGTLVKASEFSEYCSEECFRFFKNDIIQKRPSTDVWTLHQAMLEKRAEPATSTPGPGDKRSETVMVGSVLERTGGGKASRTFTIAPDPHVVALENELALQKKKDPKPAARRVTFSGEVDEVPIEARSKTAATELPEQFGGESDSDTTDEDDEDEYDSEEEEEYGLASFLDRPSKLDIKIEKAGLSAFATVWDMLTRITTDETRRYFRGGHVVAWEPESLLEVDILNGRRVYLKQRLMEGANACNLAGSDEFNSAAEAEVSILIGTLDLTRPIPAFELNHWTLMTFIFLLELENIGRFKGFDVSGYEAIKCFPSAELSSTKADQIDNLLEVLRADA